MPSPVGHSLIGLAITLHYVLPPGRWPDWRFALSRNKWFVAGAVALANAPDLDYLPGILSGDLNAYHHFYTHTLGWVVLLSLGVWLLAGGRGCRLLLFMLALTLSHLLADLVTDDGRAPYGIMALWPFSSDYLISPWPVFDRLLKREWSEFMQWHNVRAVFREFLVCGPVVALVLAGKCRAKDRAMVRG